MVHGTKVARGGGGQLVPGGALGLWVQSLDPADALLTEISRGGCTSVCAVVAACLPAGGLGDAVSHPVLKANRMH
jgi:hypothetical protein